jgi:hypothetical protein
MDVDVGSIAGFPRRHMGRHEFAGATRYTLHAWPVASLSIACHGELCRHLLNEEFQK